MELKGHVRTIKHVRGCIIVIPDISSIITSNLSELRKLKVQAPH